MGSSTNFFYNWLGRKGLAPLPRGEGGEGAQISRRKRDMTESHRGVIFHLLVRNSTFNQIQPKIGLQIRIVDTITRTKFGNDRLKEYKITEGQILPCSIGMTGWITVIDRAFRVAGPRVWNSLLPDDTTSLTCFKQ